jgi:hypothetical protein
VTPVQFTILAPTLQNSGHTTRVAAAVQDSNHP